MAFSAGNTPPAVSDEGTGPTNVLEIFDSTGKVLAGPSKKGDGELAIARAQANLRKTYYRQVKDLIKPNVLVGICYDENGKPLVNVPIEVYVRPIRGIKKSNELIKSANTDKRGQFRFDSVFDTEKLFPEGIPEFGATDQQIYFVSVVARAPGRFSKLESDTAANIAREGKVFVWGIPRASTLRGKVADTQGKPVSGARVVAGALRLHLQLR